MNGNMYSEWSILRVVEVCDSCRLSVLHKMPQINGTLLVNSCVRPLAQMLNNSSNNTSIGPNISSDFLQNDRDVLWIMEVICYGLSLPLSSPEQHECVRDCVALYSEWLCALSPQSAKSKAIPFPIRDDPNLYCRKILEHIYNIFTSRQKGNSEANLHEVLQRQGLLCHRLLRTIEGIATDEHNLMDRQTWDSLLILLLAINDTLLSPPVELNDIGTQLCERIISVLFEIWLIACCRCFPSPSFWKTFQHLSTGWRHRPALIDNWNRVNYALTLRLVQYMSPNIYDINANQPSLQKNDLNTILAQMNEETLKQCWYRFLHTIGNPVDLCSPEIISKTDKFYHSACASENVVDPRQHPCLYNLPHIFYRAMKGLSILVDTFLGIPVSIEEIDADMYKSNASLAPSSANSVQPPATPPERRKPAFPLTMNKAPNKNLGSVKNLQPNKMEPTLNPLPTITYPSVPEYVLPPTRPKSTSILDILGDWLFQSALFGTDLKEQLENHEMSRSNSSQSFNQSIDLQRKPSAASDRILIETLPLLGPESFEAGQAEAIGALCRLFCFKKADEEISLMLNKQSHPAFQKVKNYITRFHLVLQYGLAIKEPLRRQILASILINSTKIFEVDLPGASLLIPHYLKALEIYLIPKEKLNTKPDVEIRRSCIKLLLSLFSYPLHFNELPIKDTLSETPSTTFLSLRPRLINLLIQALSGETDSTNVQMILGGFLLMVSDSSINDSFTSNDSDNSVDTITTNSFNEHLRSESPGLQFGQHFSFGQTSCESSLVSTDIPLSDDGKGIPDTTKGLFSRSLFHVGQVLNRCRDKGLYDSHVSLAALEVLSAIARIHLLNGSKSALYSNCFIECKDTIKQIFSFIESQCDKPAPFHSKDLHSTIVAAYQCLAVWFHEHSHLLKDKECISMLFEVIELGISGSKSKKNGLVFKADKQLKPASMRVREAAESLLTLLMNHFGYCPPSPCPPNSIIGSALIDESNLLKFMSIGNNWSPESSCDRFKYFVSDNLIMLAILDQPNDRQTVCIIRSPFGKYCWSFRFKHFPRKQNHRQSSDPISRPLPKPEVHTMSSTHSMRNFPDSLDKIKMTKFDCIVPNLSKMIAESPEFKSDNEIMLNIIDKVENHMKYEKQKCHKTPSIGRSTECKEPMASNEFEAARLILSHFSFLTFETLQDAPPGQMIPSLIALNNKSQEFVSNLKILDSLSNRTSDTVFVYYVKTGLKNADDILTSNKSQIMSNNQFKEFVLSLGSEVNVKTHSGWTGHVSTSWKILEEDSDHEKSQHLFDGKKHVLYWADVSHELVFILPSSFSTTAEDLGATSADNASLDGEHKLRAISDVHSDARSVSSLSDDGSNQSKIVTETESNRNSLRKKFRNQFHHNIGCDVKVLIFWMESVDDQFDLPINTLLLTTGTGVEANLSLWKDYVLILINPLKSGLFRITIQGSSGRTAIFLPLIDGMVVSKHILGAFVRSTALNICRRRRLDADSFQPPHVKRRLKIQEIVNKYRLLLPESEFYNSLFTSK